MPWHLTRMQDGQGARGPGELSTAQISRPGASALHGLSVARLNKEAATAGGKASTLLLGLKPSMQPAWSLSPPDLRLQVLAEASLH